MPLSFNFVDTVTCHNSNSNDILKAVVLTVEEKLTQSTPLVFVCDIGETESM